MMIVNSYEVCKQIALSLRSIILAGNEINEVQMYSDANFGGKCKVYNQIAVDKNEYTKPYITINEIGQNRNIKESIQVDIDIAIPIDETLTSNPVEVETNGVTEYKNYYKLSEFANTILNRLSTKGTVCYPTSQMVFRPNEIHINRHEYTGSIQITFEYLVKISK